MSDPLSAPPATPRDDLGLSIDMLDVDRLREWARLLLLHGHEINHWCWWGSIPSVAGKMQIMATEMEKAIKDIGVLRAAVPAALAEPQEREELSILLRSANAEIKQLRHEWSVMARACGNYRSFGEALTPEAIERRRLIDNADYEVAARAIVERDALRALLSTQKAEPQPQEIIKSLRRWTTTGIFVLFAPKDNDEWVKWSDLVAALGDRGTAAEPKE